MSIHIEIIALGLDLGVLKRQADPLQLDCDKSVLSVFNKHKELIAQMRNELDTIYSKLNRVSREVEGICVPELKVVYEGQAKLLHGERGALNQTLDTVDSLLSAHALLEELEERVIEVHNEVIAFTEGKIGIENWDAIDSSIEDLVHELDVIFPDSEKGSKNFCQKHYESKQEVLQLLRTCSLDLNWKKSELLAKSSKECNATLGLLFPALGRLKNGKVQDRGEIQKLFGSLPLELRMYVFAARNILPDDQFENTFIFDIPDRKIPDGWTKIRGLSHYDSKRELINFQKSVRIEQQKTLLSKREEARQSLDKFVAQLPEQEMQTPQLLLEAFNQLHSKKLCYMSPEVIKTLETCMASQLEIPKTRVRTFSTPVAIKSLPKPEDSQSTPVLKSLQEIKEQVQAYKVAKRYDEPQRQQLVRTLLDVAENKGGVPLSADQGVYYWVWFLAHEKDPSAGGEHFGKNHAPKDLDLLIAAIDKAMPPMPVVKVEKVAPLPLLPQIHVRRHSTPNAQAPRPSEVKSSPQVIKVPIIMTEVKVKCIVPQGHFLTIRGEGGGLNWDRGVKLIKINEETYVHKMDGVAGGVKYKILLDDTQFESVENRTIEAQKSQEIVPALVMPKVAVVVNFAPADNRLFICGTGPGMSWDPSKKIELKRAEDKFVFESSVEIGDFLFKILLSDNRWSLGSDNFKAEKGKTVEISPKF